MPAPARVLIAALAATLALAACGGDDERGPTRSQASETAAQLDFGAVETVARGLEVPWALAFLDERTLLVTERPGRVRVVEDGRLRAEPAAELDVAAVGEAGLLGIAAHPSYPDPPVVFVYYTARTGNRVSRFRVTGDLRLRDEHVLLDRIPAAAIHDGGGIGFGPDGLLYVGTGDAGRSGAAADRLSVSGKILRLRSDGRLPSDNPFGRLPVYSYGHRNVQGLGWDADGRLYASEHGPTGEAGLCCHDEVNLIHRGGFYGWPLRTGAAPAEQGEPPDTPIDPIAESGAETTWAPAGIAVDEPEGGSRSLLVANLAGEQLLRLPLGDDGRASGRPSRVLAGFGRLRAAAFGPDGCLYLTTSNRDGRGAPRAGDDRLLRVCP